MTLESAKKILEEITPYGLTLTEFITYICSICCLYFHLTNYHVFKFNQDTVDFFSNILNFDTASFLFAIVTFFVIIDIIQFVVKFKFNLNYDPINWKIMTERFVRLFILFISIYLLEMVLLQIDGKEFENLSNYQYIYIMIYIILLIWNFIRITMNMFKERDYGLETKIKKANYLRKTIKEFENKSNEVIQKRILLYQLYELTSKVYDDGIILDDFN